MMPEQHNQIRILIIDDDECMRYSLRRILEAEQYSVLEACDGDEGIKTFRAHDVDLIVTDILMPEKEGLEVISELRNDPEKPPIIAISGGGERGNLDFLEVAKVMGAAAVLPKPLNIKRFLQVVSDLTP